MARSEAVGLRPNVWRGVTLGVVTALIQFPNIGQF
jgi:hypothetical protein